MMLNLLLSLAATSAGLSSVPLKVTRAHFYVDIVHGDGTVTTVETLRVPNVVGKSCYRWELRVPPRRGVTAVTEVMILPARPQVWGGVDGTPESPTRLSPSRRTATTPLFVPTINGKFGHGWCVAEGDPEGAYLIEVYQGRTRLRTFRFSVGPATPGSEAL